MCTMCLDYVDNMMENKMKNSAKDTRTLGSFRAGNLILLTIQKATGNPRK